MHGQNHIKFVQYYIHKNLPLVLILIQLNLCYISWCYIGDATGSSLPGCCALSADK